MELHAGFVMGQDKIITILSGEYDFRDCGHTNEIDVRVYDIGGYRKAPAPNFKVRKDPKLGWVVKVELDESKKELAVIFRYRPD